ncbi:hypothetical protein EV714DRAFT_269203 [Schizophyllum commune]
MQVADIQSGLDFELEKDITWLNTGFFLRWLAMIFLFSSPVSWRWKVALRL